MPTILSDDQKRKMYDMTGSDNGEMPGGMPGGMPFGFGGMPFDMGDLFGGMFGMPGGGPRGSRVRRQQGPPKTIEIPLTLKDFYDGRTLQVKFERHKPVKPVKEKALPVSKVVEHVKGQESSDK